MTLCADWITSADIVDCGCYDRATPSQVASVLTVASDLIYILTGRQYPGVCAETVRPCARAALSDPVGVWWPVNLGGGRWVNLTTGCGCHLSYDCTCGPTHQLDLGRSDVQSVTTVTIDGATLAGSAYRLDHNRWLVRTDGSGWPCCQNLNLPPGQDGTWTVELAYGTAVPETLTRAAATLAGELLKACVGDSGCRLPQRVQSVTRQGVSMAFLDPLEFLTDGRTGLVDVDLAITAYNPNRLRRRATVWSPEVAGRRRTV